MADIKKAADRFPPCLTRDVSQRIQ